jgi:hypothetical protein
VCGGGRVLKRPGIFHGKEAQPKDKNRNRFICKTEGKYCQLLRETTSGASGTLTLAGLKS